MKRRRGFDRLAEVPGRPVVISFEVGSLASLGRPRPAGPSQRIYRLQTMGLTGGGVRDKAEGGLEVAEALNPMLAQV